jgi:dihydrofolate synthase/folylpolyglutamate synthase
MGLERVSQVAARLDVLKPAPFVFTVAGTNGKGTTCRTLESVLMAAGYKVGVYSSPHLVRYTERFVQNSELPESAHTASFAEIEAARGEISLTYFEYGTLSALWLFKQAQLDVVILEVGLGGRLDATNIVDADVAVVTSIALDHIDWLGPDRESIGREKAGIFRANKPAVVGEPDMPHTIADVANEKGAQCCAAALTGSMRFRTTAGALATRRGRWTTCRCRRSAAKRGNRAGGTARQRPRGQRTGDPRRYTKRDSARTFPDCQRVTAPDSGCGAQPHAAAYLAGRLKSLPKTGRVLAVIGMLHDKDIGGTLACMESVVDSWYCAPLEGPRGATAEQLMEHLGKGAIYSSVAQAWHAAMAEAKPEDTVLVCGSFHTVAHVMEVMDAGRTGGE